MKNLLLIDSGLPINFLVETIDIINYLRNRLLTNYNSIFIIPKKT